jgi:hypothetical protein
MASGSTLKPLPVSVTSVAAAITAAVRALEGALRAGANAAEPSLGGSTADRDEEGGKLVPAAATSTSSVFRLRALTNIFLLSNT